MTFYSVYLVKVDAFLYMQNSLKEYLFVYLSFMKQEQEQRTTHG